MEVTELIEKGLADVKGQVENSHKQWEEKMNGALERARQEQEEKNAELQGHLDKLDIKLNSKTAKAAETKTFNQLLGETIDENEDFLKSLAGSRKEGSITLKAAGDMSYASNFAGDAAGLFTTERRGAILPERDATVYLRDIIPSGTTDAASITYPVAVGSEGTPAPWQEGTAKPIFDFDFEARNLPVQWIAGIVRVPRAMLDDVKFLKSFLQANMLKALLRAENAQILNGNGTAPNLLGLMPQATAYDGDETLLVEQLIDAAYGQLGEKGHSASHIVMNARDMVNVALNKASTSGVYDLPGASGFLNGRLTVAGLPVVSMPTVQLPAGQWLVGDFTAAQLITRLNPEIRFFEQNKDDVEKNMITIRIEERVALATYYPDAFVKKASV